MEARLERVTKGNAARVSGRKEKRKERNTGFKKIVGRRTRSGGRGRHQKANDGWRRQRSQKEAAKHRKVGEGERGLR